jgi:predicted deacylase
MIAEITPTRLIDWDSPGARRYSVPFTLDGTWGRVRLPLYVACAAQPGPTIVAIGGTHGDEYEGPVGLKNLIRELDPRRLVRGRLIVIPVLNVPAFRAGRRESPLDGGNMNRAFPGNPHGTITSRIARWVTDAGVRSWESGVRERSVKLQASSSERSAVRNSVKLKARSLLFHPRPLTPDS